jgi:septal ring factor EnvC (AmiA/AmiB activator)
MTKQEEIAAIKKFYEKLPADSYLKEILKGIPEQVESMINADWYFSISGQIDDIYQEREKVKQEIKDLQKEIARLQKETTQIEYKLQRLQETKKEAAKNLERIVWTLRTA